MITRAQAKRAAQDKLAAIDARADDLMVRITKSKWSGAILIGWTLACVAVGFAISSIAGG